MLPALWVAKTGLSAQDTNLTTISNNLANVSTTGFKRDRAEFQDLLYQIKKQPGAQSTQDSELPSGLQLGTGVQIVGTQKNFSAGNLQQTGQPLDMAINGRGFFQILQPDGTTSYTRDGTFHLDSNGQIVTANGFALEPAIVVPADANVRVTSGFLEASNVNAVDEMTSVLALAKQFELHIKMMNSAKEDDQAMTRVMQMS